MKPVVLRTRFHPMAAGRSPEAGDEIYTIHFLMEDGRPLTIEMGRVGYGAMKDIVFEAWANDQIKTTND